MTRRVLRPYPAAGEIAGTIDRLHKDVRPHVHPQRIIEEWRKEAPAFGRFNGWLADHIVGVAGTMLFFYFLGLLIAVWVLWQSAIQGDNGFDPFPYAFLFFVLGGIMQSLFVPTMLVTSNRSAMRDQIKDEADHRSWEHLYDVNNEQLEILRRLSERLLSGEATKPRS
jgi:uncharacterized membrane protein